METSLLSTIGRIRRKTYFIRLLISTLLLVAMVSISFAAHSTLLIFLSMFGMIAYNVFTVIQTCKRMHDVNKNGWYILAPVYNLILVCSEGTKGRNNYGEDPKEKAA